MFPRHSPHKILVKRLKTLIISGLVLVIFFAIVFVIFFMEAGTVENIILIAEWIFALVVLVVNLLVALYGIVCGCCYTHHFEPLVESPRIKTPFSFTVSNKVTRCSAKSYTKKTYLTS